MCYLPHSPDRSSKYRYENWPEGIWLGDKEVEGTVIKYCPEFPGMQYRGEYIEPIPAWAHVKWDNGADSAIDADNEGERWKRIT